MENLPKTSQLSSTQEVPTYGWTLRSALTSHASIMSNMTTPCQLLTANWRDSQLQSPLGRVHSLERSTWTLSLLEPSLFRGRQWEKLQRKTDKYSNKESSLGLWGSLIQLWLLLINHLSLTLLLIKDCCKRIYLHFIWGRSQSSILEESTHNSYRKEKKSTMLML